MDKGEYVGPLETLKGHTALIRPKYEADGTYMGHLLEAQFDKIGVRHPVTRERLSEGWTTFHAKDFRILIPVCV